MPIRIKCPNCQTILGVKESLAGKKANCPKCRYMLTIPVPKAAPAAPPPKPEDAEALALSTFAEESAKVVPVSTKTIEFECPFCSEMVKMSVDLAGKQAPCPNPECKRIVKVPLLKADKPKDWREMDKRGPSGALRMDKNEPEGVWSTAQKGRVSQEALLEADAIPIHKAPLSTAQRLRRGILAAVALFAVTGAAVGVFAWWNNSRLMGPFNAALGAVGPDSKLTPVGQAEIHRGLGEFYLKRGDVEKAMDHFHNVYARFPLVESKADVESDAVVLELLALLIKYGADSEVGSQLGWGTVKEELRRALHRISSVEAQQTALREVITALLHAKQDADALRLAEDLAPVPEATAEVSGDGSEDQPKQAAKARPKALSPLAAQQVVLWYVKGDDKKAKAIADSDDLVARLGWAQAHARKGEFAKGREIARAAGNDLHRLEASIAIAAIADKKSSDARTSTEDALHAYKTIKGTPKATIPIWVLVDLARTCVRNDMVKEAKEVIEAMGEKEKSARAVAQLALLQEQMDSSSAAEVPVKLIDETITAKDTFGYWAALQRVARHNTALGKRSEAVAMLGPLDEKTQPFVQIGVALGMLDAR
jgi:DNA-directed RNA polymerase subunit M/transcription elongation factor TFIIS/tetratricopeptide (TPR) repeat protein